MSQKKRYYKSPEEKKAEARRIIEEADRSIRKDAVKFRADEYGWTTRAVQLLAKAMGAHALADAKAPEDAEAALGFWEEALREWQLLDNVKPVERPSLTKEEFNTLVDYLARFIEEED